MPLPPHGYHRCPRGCEHPTDPTPKSASRRALLALNHLHGHPCVCLGPSKSNIAPDLCAPGSLCTPRQTGIFSGVCSHSRKNSQMGITLPCGTGWMSFIYNAGQNEELLSAALLLSSLSTRSCDFLVSALLCSEFGDRNVRSVVLDTNGSFPEVTQILSDHQNVRSKTCQRFCISSK